MRLWYESVQAHTMQHTRGKEMGKGRDRELKTDLISKQVGPGPGCLVGSH
jgi:hypothetical protein